MGHYDSCEEGYCPGCKQVDNCSCDPTDDTPVQRMGRKIKERDERIVALEAEIERLKARAVWATIVVVRHALAFPV